MLPKSFYSHHYAGIIDLELLPEMIISMVSKQILTERLSTIFLRHTSIVLMPNPHAQFKLQENAEKAKTYCKPTAHFTVKKRKSFSNA